MQREIPPPWVGGVAGGLAGATALAVGRLAAALSPNQPGPVTSVSNRVRDLSPGSFTRWGIDTFGTADKPLLLAGVAVVAVAIAVALGARSRTRPVVGVAGLTAFGLLGTWSMASEPTGSTGAAVGIGVTSIVAGVTALIGLLLVGGAGPAWARSWSARADARTAVDPAAVDPAAVDPALVGPAATMGPSAADPRIRHPNRRTFLVASGAVGAVAAAAAWAGRTGGDQGAVRQARLAVALPPAPGADELQAEVAAVTASPVAITPGITPLITPNDGFYRIDTALFVPQVDPAGWQLRIRGRVDREVRYSYDELVGRATTVAPLTLSCVSNEVGGGLVGNAVWQGVPLADLLEEAGIQPGADQLVGRSVDGWTAGFPTALASDGRTALVAVAMNGEPLPVRHGFPARLVVGGLYGYVSATKWLSEIELTTWDAFDAYWIPRGWAKEGPMKTQSRIDTPRAGQDVDAGTVPVAGVAWATDRGIERVEVQVDDGPWREARLAPRLDPTDTWVQWRLDWDATPGRHRLRVRATDGAGATQVEERSAVAPDGATGWHTIDLTTR